MHTVGMRVTGLIDKGGNLMTYKEMSKKEIWDYLTSVCADDATELVSQISSREGKEKFAEFLNKIQRKDSSAISNVAVNSALNLTVTSTDNKEYVINQIIERLSKHFKE